MYGQTEATARMSYLSPNDAISRLGSIGIAIPGGKFFIGRWTRVTLLIKVMKLVSLFTKEKNVCMGYATSAKDLSKGDEKLWCAKKLVI